ncbi:MAG TPA: penicillin-insensitive murein endopeptidase [Enhygromyxa sp.]|nr:penicillin-insensitive murein endopeptidase [Enhygromyxa sp.]
MRRSLLAVLGLATIAVALAGPPRSAWAGPRAYVVKPGDTLWELAADSGCTIDQLRKLNELGPDEPLVVGRELDLSACASAKQGASGKRYKVVSGDNLASIARRHGTTVDELRRLNDLDGSLIRVGQELKVPGEATRSIRLLTGQSRGTPGHGWLHKPTQLPRSSHYYRRRPERTYATAHVVDHTLNAIHEARQSFPKAHRLAIGDLSDQDGGPLSGHASHQSGRDIDIGFYYRKVPSEYPKEFADASEDNLDAAATWALLESFIRSAGQPGGVEKVFLDYEVQGWLYAAARKDGWSKSKLADVFQYPDGRYAKHGLVRHEPNHRDHLHVRFTCVPDDAACK